MRFPREPRQFEACAVVLLLVAFGAPSTRPGPRRGGRGAGEAMSRPGSVGRVPAFLMTRIGNSGATPP